MKDWIRRLISVIAPAVIVLSNALPAHAGSCTLELKRLKDTSSRSFTIGPDSDFIYRMTHSQHFWMQLGVQRTDEKATSFPKVVKKELSKYACEHPFRCVAELGSWQFGFVLDSTEPKKKGYHLLYFDLNHNGDLTDDKVIEAREPGNFWGDNSANREFPRVDVPLDVEGTKMEYAFFLQVQSQFQQDFTYISSSLNAGAYRAGEITLDGKQRRIALVDFNSNGRFDDEFKVNQDVRTSNGAIYPQTGDILLIDPNNVQGSYGYDVTMSTYLQQVSKLVNIEDRFYDLKISPAGDKLTLTPSSAAVGSITNPNTTYCAVVYSDKGFLKIRGTASAPVPLPEGDWKLLNYTIDLTEHKEPKSQPATEEKPKERRSLLQRLAAAITGSGNSDDKRSVTSPRFTLVSASGTTEYKAVQVRKGKTVELPFGPPYKPLVKAPYKMGNKQVRLEMSLIGSANEVCTNLMVNGDRPAGPSFAIATPKGEIVERGRFEYG